MFSSCAAALAVEQRDDGAPYSLRILNIMSSADDEGQQAAAVIEAGELSWIVNKFGGTSVASAEAMGRAKDIIMGQVHK